MRLTISVERDNIQIVCLNARLACIDRMHRTWPRNSQWIVCIRSIHSRYHQELRTIKQSQNFIINQLNAQRISLLHIAHSLKCLTRFWATGDVNISSSPLKSDASSNSSPVPSESMSMVSGSVAATAAAAAFRLPDATAATASVDRNVKLCSRGIPLRPSIVSLVTFAGQPIHSWWRTAIFVIV